MEKIYVLINKLANMQRRYFDSRKFAGRYSGAQAKVLDHLFHNEDKTVFQKNIEKEFGMRPPTATALLKSMVDSGLIRRESMENDARYKRIIPTDISKTLKSDISASTKELENTLKQNVDPDELEIWRNVTLRMIKNLDKEYLKDRNDRP